VCERGSNLESIADLSAIPAQMGAILLLVIITLCVLDNALCHDPEAWLLKFGSLQLTLLFFFNTSEPLNVDAEYLHCLMS
jgi:hypothetical protein